MPRKANENIDEVIKKTVKKETATKKVATKKSTTKKANSKTTTKKSEVNKTPSKKTSTTTKKISKKVEKNNTTVKSIQSKKTTTKNTVKKDSKPSENKIEVLEYYDLPYRYNETVVKVLAQTPKILFVYWDISDTDKENYIKQYGEYFFNDTIPVLIVYNDTLNYSFEVPINDFANSWYLNISDSNCDYHVELGRRPINEYAKIDNYLSISSSNNMDAPNDRILFDSLNDNVYFRNVKTNITSKKELTLSFFSKIGKIYNVKNFYKELYKDEHIDFEKLNLKNMPSS